MTAGRQSDILLAMESLEISLWLPRPRQEVYAYFADVRNLDLMTPGWLRFVPRALPPPLAKGVTIDYRFRWHGLPLPWRSEIADWRPPRVFTYRQARGPYREFWHEHRYAAERGGTRVTDRMRWRLFGGALVAPVAGPIVRRELQRIFDHRNAHVSRLAADGPLVRALRQRDAQDAAHGRSGKEETRTPEPRQIERAGTHSGSA